MTGTYYYHFAVTLVPSVKLQPYSMPVEVIGEKGNRYEIRYGMRHMDGSPPGSTHWVQKRKVKVNRPPVSPDNINLPYKD